MAKILGAVGVTSEFLGGFHALHAAYESLSHRFEAFRGNHEEFVLGFLSGRLQFRKASTGEILNEPLPKHESWVRSAAISGDGRTLVCGCEDGTVRV